MREIVVYDKALLYALISAVGKFEHLIDKSLVRVLMIPNIFQRPQRRLALLLELCPNFPLRVQEPILIGNSKNNIKFIRQRPLFFRAHSHNKSVVELFGILPIDKDGRTKCGKMDRTMDR